MAKFITLVWKNATRNRRRSLLTIASIAASFCLLGVLMAIYVTLFLTTDESPAGSRRPRRPAHTGVASCGVPRGEQG